MAEETALGVLGPLRDRLDKLERIVQGTNGSGVVTELKLLNARIDTLSEKVDAIVTVLARIGWIIGTGLLLAVIAATAKYIAAA